jgi:glycosyl transferase family 25
MVPIYVISLPNSEERRAFMRAQLNALGLPFRFFDAVDGRTLEFSQLEEMAPKGGAEYSGLLTSTEVGCAMSHLAAIKEIAERNDEYAIVLEDDVLVAPGFRKFAREEYLRSLHRFDILQLDGSHLAKPRFAFEVGRFDEYELRALPTGHHSMYALVYARDAARRISASLPVVTAPIDNMIFKDGRVTGLCVLSLRPSVVRHMGLPSVIGERPRLRNNRRKVSREVRRFRSWLRRWYSFSTAWGLRGIFALRRTPAASVGESTESLTLVFASTRHKTKGSV